MIQSRQRLQDSIQVIVQVVPTRFLLELDHFGILVNEQNFNASHLGKIMRMFSRDRVTKARVARAACIDPRYSCNFEIRAQQPEGALLATGKRRVSWANTHIG